MSKRRCPRYKDLRLSQMRSFCEVCRQGSFAAAAEALGLATPTVWEQVRALEAHYGVALLNREGRAVHLSPEGAVLYEMVARMLAEYDATHEAIQQRRGTLPKRIAVVVSVRVHMHEVLRALRHFQARHPTVTLCVREVGSGEIAPLLINGEADLGVMLEPRPSDHSPAAIVYDLITDIDFLLVAPLEHPLIHKRQLRISDIIEYPLVLGRPEAFSRRRFEDVLHAHALGDRARIAVETSSSSLTLAAVREGLGVGIVACAANGVLTGGLGVRPLRRWFGRAQVTFARRHGAPLPPVQYELAEAIRDSITQGIDQGRVPRAQGPRQSV